MIVLPSEHLMILAQEHIKDFNRQPAVGTEGHVSDHKTIVDILLTIPNARIMYGQVWKEEGQWYKLTPGVLNDWNVSNEDPPIETIDFNEVRRVGETPGMIYIAGDPLDLADGVTDYKEDVFPDQTILMVYPAGLFGLDQVVPELIQEIHSLRARLSELESKIPQ